MKITEHAYKRKLPANLRRELFTYIPRKRAVGMEPEEFEAVMRAYGREDLGLEALRLMGFNHGFPGTDSANHP